MSSDAASPLAVSMENLRRDFVMGDVVVQALRGVTIDIPRGEMVAIIGPSGSGKSTLMHLIGCLDTPTAGSITINGIETTDMDETELAELRNQTIGFVFQNFNLLPRLNALENVMTPLMYSGVPARQRKILASEALERVGLGDRMHHKPKELSGGQKQRVAIARALVTDPTIILADEPTGALDSVTEEVILSLFQEIHKEGRTIIIVTHEHEISTRCPRIIKIRDGLVDLHESHIPAGIPT